MGITLPPSDGKAEGDVIGSLLLDGNSIGLVEHMIKPSDFYLETNQVIYNACLVLRDRRESINETTLAQELSRTSKLEFIGGVSQLSYLISICPTSLDIEYYADIVRRLSIGRKLIMFGENVVKRGYNIDPDTNKSIDDIYSDIVNFRRDNTTTDNIIKPKGAADIVYNLIEEYQKPPSAIKYGFRDIDNITSGIYPEMIVLGGRPSVGKTQFMLDILENISNQDKKSLFCSVEMGVKSILERKVARKLKTGIKELRKHGLDSDKMKSLSDLAAEISEEDVHYLSQGISSEDIYTEAKRMQDSIGLDIIFVDYLQLLKDCWGNGRDNQTVRVGRACKVIKSIVNDMNIPVIMASQLSRASEYRSGENRFPILADLRESGDIEQDADVVFLLHRDKETDDGYSSKGMDSNILRVTMAKNRQLGWSKAISLLWKSDLHRYVDTTKRESVYNEE